MLTEYILRALLGLLLKNKVLGIGTKYSPNNAREREYVDMINYTKTMLIEIKRADINSQNIFNNLIREVGSENIPPNRKFIELEPPLDKVDEYALFSNIIIGSDRYLYIEVFNKAKIIKDFIELLRKEKGKIIEKSPTEVIARLPSKNDAIRAAIKLIGLASAKKIGLRAAVGMTGAAAIERSIRLNKEVGEIPGVGFTKLGGEFALIFPTPFNPKEGEPSPHDNYLFIDVINSTSFIEEYGKGALVEIMNDIKSYIEKECKGKIEGYKEGGDDLIANLPSKDIALRATIDAAWHALANGAKIRAGIGKTRREAAERAQLADDIKLWNPATVIIFDVADGLYGYFIPNPFTRAVIDYLFNEKSKLIIIFIFVFMATFLGWNLGYWQLGLLAILLVILYGATT
ncbi:hypothetical protein [Methanothermobacter tenebrarum]|uniref:Uncharacterized protein n=1 Tax=Methanothermobacter tenebrarum TaxID=680118 RepID=A0A328PAR3_9EURY|nr:hypothetical protein [Methanothermobacter tenebrarum]NPV64569.1 hypothetical protein [Methanobacteriaceae archaeon]RAO78700.1 hypothetical protein DPC56_06920 [Methanothermobacter tenebrarum]